MENSQLLVSPQTLIRIFLVFLYVPIGLIVYRRLFPRLLPVGKHLATVMIAAQVLVIALSLEIRPVSVFEAGLWDLDNDWNIPSTLASTQFVLTAGVALAAARLTHESSAWKRLYLVLIGLVFLWLGIDESFMLHEYNPILEQLYIILGAVIATATVAVALHSPRRVWVLYVCLLIGLAMSVMGALIIDKLPWHCTGLGFVRLDGCLNFLFLEEALEFLGIWLALVSTFGLFSDATPRAKMRVRILIYAIPGLWILLLITFSLLSYFQLQHLDRRVFARFESGVQIHGYDLEVGAKTFRFEIFASATQTMYRYMDLGFSVHLVDQVSGESIAGGNENWCCQHSLQGFVPVYREVIEIDLPSQVPINRALWIVLTLWRDTGDGMQHQEVLSSDHRLLSERQVVLGELVLPAESAFSSSTPVAVFENGFGLQAADVTDRARPGETLRNHIYLASDVAGTEDHVQFLHLGHEESGDWWVYDQQPLGSAFAYSAMV